MLLRAGVGGEVRVSAAELELLRKLTSLLKVLMKHAVDVGAEFAESCGRTLVRGQDVRLALQFLSHEFFTRDIDEEFRAALREEVEHTYMTDDDEGSTSETDDDEGEEGEEGERGGSSTSGGSSSGDDDDDDVEPYTTAYVTGDAAQHERILQYARDWDDWHPDDEAQQLCKRAIDRMGPVA